MFDLKILGGTVVDGTGAERFTGDIGITGGRIVEVRRRGTGDTPLEGAAAETIDATSTWPAAFCITGPRMAA